MSVTWDMFEDAKRAATEGHHELTEDERAALVDFVERALGADVLDRQRELDQLFEDAGDADALDDALI